MICVWIRMVRITNIPDTLQGECICKGMEKNAKCTKIDWCEGDLQLADIGTKNVSEPDRTQIIKYIMARLEN